MNIGQRINLIKKIARKMSESDFADGDLILRQFKFPTSDDYGFKNEYDYYMRMIEDGKSQILIDLHDYLFPDDLLPNDNLKSKSGWSNNGSLRLFLSHSTTKKLIVTQVKNELKKFGIDCFVAHEDIEPTLEWLKEIQVALASCHCFVAFLCSEFRKSAFCDQEVGFSLQRGILTIPVRLEIDPYGFMSPLQGVTAFNRDPSEIALEIHSILEKNMTTKSLLEIAKLKVLENLVDRFLKSSNFGDSSDLLKQLEKYPAGTIPQGLLKNISTNWKKNPQVSGCNGVPRRVGDLLFLHDYEENSSAIPF